MNFFKGWLASSGLIFIWSPLLFAQFYQLLLARFSLPANILSTVFAKRWQIIPIVIIIYLIILYLTTRFIFFPSNLTHGDTIIRGLINSWKFSQKPWPKEILFGGLMLLLTAIIWLVRIKLGEQLLTLFSHQYSLIFALLIYALIGNVLFALLIVKLLNQQKLIVNDVFDCHWLLLSVLGLIAITILNYHSDLTAFQPNNQPYSISHRGISQKNAIQNTITGLTDTNLQWQPDLVEIDLQETSDHQLVVVHDPNLKKLTGRDLNVDQLTWPEIQQLTLKENNYTDKISLFSDYLVQANQLEQKLLIELKPSTKTQETIVSALLPFKEQLSNHFLQSMSLKVSEETKKYFFDNQVGYILPFDFLGVPKNNLDFINIEQRTANPYIIQALKNQNKDILIWTLHTKKEASQLKSLAINGLLTDDLSKLKSQATLQNFAAFFLRLY
ncbi:MULTISPECIES: glycerophosphodiester phosphodiesterase family protein [Enterococcus]|uniref:glycerophosphodiester phosphodiesterase family protein n=1 Tax=Enterococcus sp. AZ103 TaxID=2774628 RepID=UPI003F68855E